MTADISLIDLTRAIVALFIIMDPLGNIPVFLGLTRDMDEAQRKKVFHVATIVSFVLLVVFSLLGRVLLNVFGISIHNFMIAGGLLLLILAIKLLIEGEWREPAVSPESVAAVPMAFPLLAGPGAITTGILILETSGILVILTALSVNFAAVWVIFRYIHGINRLLGRTGSAVVARVMAVFIAAIAVGFITEGITGSFPGLTP